ncbi:MAG: thiamine pyrophosphate-dependent enzyme, partial [Achromobacter mucicolens]
DFVAYAQSFGVTAERVQTHEAFTPALARALDSGTPYLIELSLDPEVITPRATLTSLREKARTAGA